MPLRRTLFAVGLLQLRSDASQAERTQARIELALRAVGAGYILIETYETGSNGMKEDAAFKALEEMAIQLGTRALVYAGHVDLARVNELADRTRMALIHA